LTFAAESAVETSAVWLQAREGLRLDQQGLAHELVHHEGEGVADAGARRVGRRDGDLEGAARRWRAGEGPGGGVEHDALGQAGD
jgi:hypothetical protein